MRTLTAVVAEFERLSEEVSKIETSDADLVEIKKAISIYTVMIVENNHKENPELVSLVEDINNIIELYLINKD